MKKKKRKSKYTPGKFDLQVKRSKTGRGLFTIGEIPKGACIVRYKGRKVSEAEEYNSRGGKYFFDTGEGTIDGNIAGNIARYINHSCKPNCEADGPKGRVFIWAMRRIKPGEELTYDYGKEYFADYLSKDRCRCGKCRVTSARPSRSR
ncbi:MAG: SET domain-containing protein [Patescibacteria group bacterium]